MKGYVVFQHRYIENSIIIVVLVQYSSNCINSSSGIRLYITYDVLLILIFIIFIIFTIYLLIFVNSGGPRVSCGLREVPRQTLCCRCGSGWGLNLARDNQFLFICGKQHRKNTSGIKRSA